MKKDCIRIIFVSILMLLSLYCIYQYLMNTKVEVDKKIEHVDIRNVNKVMIVAHPDDDFIFGGSHLLEEDYLVVCITCGASRKRVLEFVKAMLKTEDVYLMLGYPDKTKGQRDDWSQVYRLLYEDLKHILTYKDWEEIVTHNPDGEYGHIHHKMTSEIVTSLAAKEKLFYFGKYYKKKEVPSTLKTIGEENRKKKQEELIPIYASQKATMKKLEHMFAYENWVKYEDWYFEK